MEFSILQSHIFGKVRPYMIVNEMIYHFPWGFAYISTPGGAKGMRHPVDALSTSSAIPAKNCVCFSAYISASAMEALAR